MRIEFGTLKNAERGRGNCECPYDGCYTEYLVHYGAKYFLATWQHEWKFFSLEYGAIVAFKGRGWCEEMGSVFPGSDYIVNLSFKPSSRIRYTVGLSNEYRMYSRNRPLIYGIEFNLTKYNKIWLGALLDKPHPGMAGRVDYAFRYLFLRSESGYIPDRESYFVKVHLGILLN
jgi:hypothetical protein